MTRSDQLITSLLGGNTATRARRNHESWIQERSRKLDRICRQIQDCRNSGQPLKQAVQHLSRHWKGRKFQADKSKRWHLSPSRLTVLYYLWLKQGPDVLRLRYRGPSKRPLTSSTLNACWKRLANPQSKTIVSAYRALRRNGQLPSDFSVDRFRRLFSSEARSQFRWINRARHELDMASRKLEKMASLIADS
jgi:hypothetical protein